MSWPQLIVTDSSRSGKLPFAPFKRTQEESAQQPKADKIIKKVVRQNLPIKTDSINVTATVVDTIKPFANDSVQAANDSSVADMSRLFRFTDEENDELNNSDQQFISSSAYFRQHQLEVKSLSPQLFNKTVPDWFTIVIFSDCGHYNSKSFLSEYFQAVG